VTSTICRSTLNGDARSLRVQLSS